ncbi:MAG: hypothetical protein RR115_01270 [Hydrogenoanaerobacterium sp.]
MKPKLFNNKITPSCNYCAHGDISRDKTVVLCEKKGIVGTNSSCRSFLYSPLKRVPKKPMKLPEFNKSDFEL